MTKDELEKYNQAFELKERLVGFDKGTAPQLAMFIVFLRLIGKDEKLSNTELIYALKAYLDIDSDEANKAINCVFEK